MNIPSEINGTPVTTIGNAAFRDSSVTSVTIPASVTEIGANAFAGCTNLTSVTYGGDWSNLTIQSGNPAVQDAANEQLFDFEFILNNTAVIVKHYRGGGGGGGHPPPRQPQTRHVEVPGVVMIRNPVIKNYN